MHIEAATVLLPTQLPAPTSSRFGKGFLTDKLRNSVCSDTEDFSPSWPYFPLLPPPCCHHRSAMTWGPQFMFSVLSAFCTPISSFLSNIWQGDSASLMGALVVFQKQIKVKLYGTEMRNRRSVFSIPRYILAKQEVGMTQPVSSFTFVSEHIHCFVIYPASYSHILVAIGYASCGHLSVMCVVEIEGNPGTGEKFLLCMKDFCTFNLI